MKPFRHFDADSVDEALALLTEYDGKARVTAGGTDLLGVLKSEILADYPEAVINLKTISGLDGIEVDDGGLRLGALTRLADIVDSPAIKKDYPALAMSAASVGSPELRNMGTIGGNLCQDTRCWYYRYPDKMGGRLPCYRKGKGPCHAIKGDNRFHAVLGGRKCYAVCSSDLAIALAALAAAVKTVRPVGERTIPLSDFYDTLGPVLEADELVTEIRIPAPAENTMQRFSKFRLRESIDFALVSVAVVLDMAQGVCRDARIVLGAVAPVPYRAVAAEDVVRGRPLDERQAGLAAEAALRDAKPMSGNAYKIEIAKTLVKRVLRL
ncbi:MAG: xanthine dehydrogenase family protein subunit M [Desulfobacteraceae bacterium]|jgi:xanthine dehydrogenase YagS FAD-binding subunit